MVYVGDGRFHLEAVMIANPQLRAFRYDPYEKKLTEEFYDHETMRTVRGEAIERAARADTFGLVLGTLGRQGNPGVLNALQRRINSLGKENVVILLSEIFPEKIGLFRHIDAFVQVTKHSCIIVDHLLFIYMLMFLHFLELVLLRSKNPNSINQFVRTATI